ncbi:MAG: GlgB N-terminal domain-containing protein, partial [Tsuneonella sp.]
MNPSSATIDALLAGGHDDPFSLLGPHDGPEGTFARAILPGAESAEAYSLAGGRLGKLSRVDQRGLFEGKLRGKPKPIKYRCQSGASEWWVTDPYSFGPVLGPVDDLLVAEGTHFRLFDKMGAHVIDHEGCRGVHFAVWAPNAQQVSIVGDFNNWDGTRHPMRARRSVGIWEIFLPEIGFGSAYKYRIVGADGVVQPLKADPFAFASELRPKTASIVAEAGKSEWGDDGHRAHWANVDPRREPISIYEVHPGSWQRDDNDWFLGWDEMAARLIPYVVEMGFTHIEFMPVSEHPY